MCPSSHVFIQEVPVDAVHFPISHIFLVVVDTFKLHLGFFKDEKSTDFAGLLFFFYFPIPLHKLDYVAAALAGGALGSLSFTNLDFNIRQIRLILSRSFPKMLS